MSPGLDEYPHGGKISPAENHCGKTRFHSTASYHQKPQSEHENLLTPAWPLPATDKVLAQWGPSADSRARPRQRREFVQVETYRPPLQSRSHIKERIRSTRKAHTCQWWTTTDKANTLLSSLPTRTPEKVQGGEVPEGDAPGGEAPQEDAPGGDGLGLGLGLGSWTKKTLSSKLII